MQPSLPAPSPLAEHWQLDPSTVFLNHGSFGACPRKVLEAQRSYRDLMEADPVRFFVQLHEPLLDASRAELAAFLGCAPADLVFIPNATIAVATVLAALEPTLRPGDELLTNNHEYPACQHNLKRTAQRTGAVIVSADLPFPIKSDSQITEALLAKVTPRTRLALLSAVTSPSGLALPVRTLVPELERRGIRVMLDAAHAPGMLPFNLGELKPSFCTANSHKWLCTPKGSAFLYVREDHRPAVRPLILSNSAEKPKPGRGQFWTDFDFVGTDDPSAYLATADSIRTVGSLVPGGWPEVMRRNHDLVLKGRDTICRAIGVEPPAPDSMLGTISSILLPPHTPERHARLAARPSAYHDALQDILLRDYSIQVPLWHVPGTPPGSTRLIRISSQLYNSPAQYDYLAAALKRELDREFSL
jgi:isopenicillin-N epimerase